MGEHRMGVGGRRREEGEGGEGGRGGVGGMGRGWGGREEGGVDGRGGWR